MKLPQPKGVATIPIVLVFGVLIVAIGVGITAMSLTESIASQGSYQATRALLFAEAGARDALMRLARDKQYSCTATDCYSLSLGTNGCSDNSACARMSVSSAAGTTLAPKVITAKGLAGANVRTLQVSVVYDSSQYGRIASTTWVELSL